MKGELLFPLKLLVFAAALVLVFSNFSIWNAMGISILALGLYIAHILNKESEMLDRAQAVEAEVRQLQEERKAMLAVIEAAKQINRAQKPDALAFRVTADFRDLIRDNRE